MPVSTQFGSALAGTYNSEARADKVNPASWRTLKRVDDYRPIFNQIRSTPEPVLEKELRAASLEFIREHPGYVVTVAWWTTRRMLDLAGMDWSIHTAATISRDPRPAIAGVDLLLGLRAAGGVRRVHPAGAGGAAVGVGGAAADVPQRRLPRGGDAALPDRDRPVHRAARGAGAHAHAAMRPSGPVSHRPSSCGSSSHASASCAPALDQRARRTRARRTGSSAARRAARRRPRRQAAEERELRRAVGVQQAAVVAAEDVARDLADRVARRRRDEDVRDLAVPGGPAVADELR